MVCYRCVAFIHLPEPCICVLAQSRGSPGGRFTGAIHRESDRGKQMCLALLHTACCMYCRMLHTLFVYWDVIRFEEDTIALHRGA